MIMQKVGTSQCESMLSSKLSVVDETLRKLVQMKSDVHDQKLLDLEQQVKDQLVRMKGQFFDLDLKIREVESKILPPPEPVVVKVEEVKPKVRKPAVNQALVEFKDRYAKEQQLLQTSLEEIRSEIEQLKQKKKVAQAFHKEKTVKVETPPVLAPVPEIKQSNEHIAQNPQLIEAINQQQQAL